MSNIINIQIDEGATFTKVLNFTKEVVTGEYVHPITGQKTILKERQPIDLTGYKVESQIRSEPSPHSSLIAGFSTTILSSTQGKIAISLSKEQTLSLAHYLSRTGLNSRRIHNLGFYDIILISPEGSVTRVFEGKCYLNRSATKNPYVTSMDDIVISTSPKSNNVTDPIEVSVDSSKPHYNVGFRYFNGGVEKIPTQGTISLYRMPETTQTYNSSPVATISATNVQAEIYWSGNTSKVKAVPDNLSGVDSFQVVVAANSTR